MAGHEETTLRFLEKVGFFQYPPTNLCRTEYRRINKVRLSSTREEAEIQRRQMKGYQPTRRWVSKVEKSLGRLERGQCFVVAFSLHRQTLSALFTVFERGERGVCEKNAGIFLSDHMTVMWPYHRSVWAWATGWWAWSHHVCTSTSLALKQFQFVWYPDDGIYFTSRASKAAVL